MRQTYDFGRLYRMVAPNAVWMGSHPPFGLSLYALPDSVLLTEVYYVRLATDPILAWLLTDHLDGLLGLVRYHPALKERGLDAMLERVHQDAVFGWYTSAFESDAHAMVKLFVQSEPFYQRTMFLKQFVLPDYPVDGITRQMIEDGLAHSMEVTYILWAIADDRI